MVNGVLNQECIDGRGTWDVGRGTWDVVVIACNIGYRIDSIRHQSESVGRLEVVLLPYLRQNKNYILTKYIDEAKKIMAAS